VIQFALRRVFGFVGPSSDSPNGPFDNLKLVEVTKELGTAGTRVFILPFASLPFYGTSKSLAAYAMVERAFEKGYLEPDRVVVEPTSGNTGLALAEILNTLGVPFVMVVSRKIAKSFEETLKEKFRAFVLEVEDPTSTEPVMSYIRSCPKGPFVLLVKLPINFCPTDEPTGAIAYSKKLVQESGGRIVMLDQYNNPANPEIHRKVTAHFIHHELKRIGLEGYRINIYLSGGTFGTALGLSQYFANTNLDIRLNVVLPSGDDIFGVVDLRAAKLRTFFKSLEEVNRLNNDRLVRILEMKRPIERISRLWSLNEQVFGKLSSQLTLDVTGGYSSLLALSALLDDLRANPDGTPVNIVLFHDSAARYEAPRSSSPEPDGLVVGLDEATSMIGKGARVVYIDPLPGKIPEELIKEVSDRVARLLGVKSEKFVNISDALVTEEQNLSLREEFTSLFRGDSPVVLVCPHRGSSRVVGAKLRQAGVPNVYSLDQGMDALS